MKAKFTLKKLIIAIVAVIVAAAVAVGCVFLIRSNAKPVPVVPFLQVGMTEFWGDNQESSGLVTTDKIQTIYLTETQKVTEILVQMGDTVKKGDLLMTFDTTLSDLTVEKERLKVEKLKLEIQDAKAELARINQLRPMVIQPPAETPSEPEDLGVALTGRYQILSGEKWDGSTQEYSLICWLGSNTQIDDNMLSVLLEKARELQEKNQQLPDEPVEGETEESSEPTDPTDQTDPPEPVEINSYFVIFKITEKDMSKGENLTWQGLQVTRNKESGKFTFRFFDAASVDDPTQEMPDIPEFDFGSGFTAAQIAQMRSEQEKRIKELNFNLKMAETDYKIMLTEVGDGNVYAQIDGTVVSLLTEEEAQSTMQPLLKVSGGGGFYITGSVSELSRENLRIGQEVTVNDWYTGMVYTGSIVSVNDYPGGEQYYGGGNPNVSYYNFTVFVDGSADLMAGNYASIQFSAASASSGIFLENPYLRTESGRSYVMVQDAEGKLEKRYVTVGRSLWGSYTEILSGLTAEDYLAFPYGKDAVEGAPTEVTDLYGMIMY